MAYFISTTTPRCDAVQRKQAAHNLCASSVVGKLSPHLRALLFISSNARVKSFDSSSAVGCRVYFFLLSFRLSLSGSYALALSVLFCVRSQGEMVFEKHAEPVHDLLLFENHRQLFMCACSCVCVFMLSFGDVAYTYIHICICYLSD